MSTCRFSWAPGRNARRATYLAREINGQTEISGEKRPARPEIRPAVLAFDPEEDDYVLLAWSVPGQKTISDCDATWC